MSRRKQSLPNHVKDDESPDQNSNSSSVSTNRKESTDKDSDASDKNKDYSPVKRVYCKVCGKSMRSQQSLQRHLLTHSEVKNHQCPKCDSAFKTSSNLHRHMKIHERERVKQAAPPPPVPTSKQEKRSARQNKVPNKFKDFDAEIPGIKKSEDEDDVEGDNQLTPDEMGSDLIDRFGGSVEDSLEQNDVSMSSVGDDATSSCSICEQSFSCKEKLDEHYKSCHAEQQNFVCGDCNKTFKDQKSLNDHMIAIHPTIDQKMTSSELRDLKSGDFSLGSFPSIETGQTETTISSISEVNGVENSSISCQDCGHTFADQQSLANHMETTHGKTSEEPMVDGNSDSMNSLQSLSDLTQNWMQKSDDKNQDSALNQDGQLEENDERPPLKLKICRRKSTPTDQVNSPPKSTNGPYFIGGEGGESNSSDNNKNNNTIIISHPMLQQNINKNIRSVFENAIEQEQRESFGASPKSFAKETFQRKHNSGGASKRVAMVCRLCNYSTEEKSALIRHYRTHTGIRPFFCKVCKDSFTNKANCERHIKKRHMEAIGQDIKSAVGCDLELLQRVDMSNKRMLALMPIEKSVLPFKHIGTKQQSKQLRPDVQKKFPCTMCGLSFNAKSNFMEHMINKHQNLPKEKLISMIKEHTTKILPMADDELTTVSAPTFVPQESKIKTSSGQAIHLQSIPVNESSSQSFVTSQHLNRKRRNEISDPIQMEQRLVTMPIKKPKVIPLLKIKAYSEAASTFYSKMTETYTEMIDSGMFLKNSRVFKLDKLQDENILNIENTMGNQTDSVPHKPHKCHVCHVSFEHEDHLNCHMAINHENINDFPPQPTQVPRLQGAAKRKQFKVLRAEGGEYHQKTPPVISSFVPVSDTYSNEQEYLERETATPQPSHEESMTSVDNDNADQPIFDNESWGNKVFRPRDNTGRYAKWGEESVDGGSPLVISESRPTMVTMPGLPAISNTSLSIMDATTTKNDQVLVPSKGRFYKARKCPQCDKSFPWASSLRRHIMTHTGLKLYMCRMCSMRFTTRSNLVRHVYRRHGIAKQHPDFKSCLAKLHPSDNLLQKMEANVRKGKGEGNNNPGEEEMLEEGMDEEVLDDPEDDSLVINDEQEDGSDHENKGKPSRNAFQREIESDPNTKLVSLDYSPRGDMADSPSGGNANKSPKQSALTNGEEVTNGMSGENNKTPKSKFSLSKILPKSEPTKNHIPLYKRLPQLKVRNKQSTQFVCGVCKVIFETVPQLITHLKIHNVAHPWHCPICAAPFTNKYNCHRHIARRHDVCDMQPIHMDVFDSQNLQELMETAKKQHQQLEKIQQEQEQQEKLDQEEGLVGANQDSNGLDAMPTTEFDDDSVTLGLKEESLKDGELDSLAVENNFK